jgi:hypothetical protein
LTQEQRISWWQVFSKFQLSREKTWQPVIQSSLKNQIKPVVAYLKENGVDATISHVDFLVQSAEMTKVVNNIYVDAGRVFGGKAYQLVKKLGKESKQLMPMGYNEELVQEIIQYFQLHLLNAAVLPISEKTKKEVLKVLTDAQLNGVNMNDIVNELQDSDLTYERSRTIARTETVKAANYGAVQSVKKLDYDTLKIWISAQDNRTRRVPKDKADHLHANGQTVAMDEPFKIMDLKAGGYVNMMQPGDPNGGAENCVNCRCTVGFEIL